MDHRPWGGDPGEEDILFKDEDAERDHGPWTMDHGVIVLMRKIFYLTMMVMKGDPRFMVHGSWSMVHS
jgi:hypothetical protein